MMVAIAGGHGQVALLLAEELVRRDHEPIGLVRNADHLPDLVKRGARGVVVDLEHTTVEADADLRGRESLEWTIVRPGRLSDDEGTGQVDLGPDRSRGSVPRADVAAVLAELITTGRGVRQQVDLVAGRVPVAEAVASLGD